MSSLRGTGGRTSCWVLGGIGCLGLLVVFAILLFFGARQLGSMFGDIVQQSMVIEQEVKPPFQVIANAIKQYHTDTGKFPPNLNALTPKYLKPDALKPITLKDGTQIKWVYRPPKPDSAGDTVILEHTPPVTAEMKFVQTVKANLTLQLNKDFSMMLQQEMITPDGKRQIQKQSLN